MSEGRTPSATWFFSLLAPPRYFDRFTSTRRSWMFATVLLCLVGFCKEMRPSEPFLTEYLVSNDTEGKNLTLDEVNSQVYPVWSYTFLGALVPVFLLTDVLRYRPVLMFETVALAATFALLLWARGLSAMKFMQVTYGLSTASEIGYYTYIYAAVTSQHFQKVTSLTRGSALLARFAAGVLGQVLVSTHTASYYDLTAVSFGMVTVACVLTCALPPIGKSIYFRQLKRRESTHTIVSVSAESNSVIMGASGPVTSPGIAETTTPRPAPQGTDAHGTQTPSTRHSGRTGHVQDETDYEVSGDVTDETPDLELRRPSVHKRQCCRCCCGFFERNFKPIIDEFKSCYGNTYTLKWSIWWALGTCGYYQVGNYIQNLWEDIYHKNNIHSSEIYNGAVEATTTLLGALVVLGLAVVTVNWKVFGEALLGLVSVIGGVMLVIMAWANNVWVAYVFYALYRASYHLVITVASYQIAGQLTLERYGLVFGFNTFMALVCQALLTLIVVDKRGLNAPINIQFTVTGGYHVVMGLVFLAAAALTLRMLGLREAWRQRRAPAEPYAQLKD